MKRIGMYLRVSTQDKQSTEIQESEIRQYLTARNLTDSVVVYQDKATGTNGNREDFKALMLDARQRKLDLVICWKLDRLFRSLKDLITTLQEFNELGVEFISLKDNVDFTTSAGRLLIHIVGAFGEFEASLIRERVRAGVANAKRKGKRLGRPSTVNHALVSELRKSGLSLSEIAKQLGVSKTAVHKSLNKTALQVPVIPTSEDTDNTGN